MRENDSVNDQVKLFAETIGKADEFIGAFLCFSLMFFFWLGGGGIFTLTFDYHKWIKKSP